MRFRLVGLLLFFCLGVFAEDTELAFQRGKVRLRGNRIEVETPDGYRAITNLWPFDKAGNEVSLSSPVAQGTRFKMGPYPGALRDEAWLNFAVAELKLAPVPNITTAYFRHEGEEFLALAFNKSSIQHGNYGPSHSLSVYRVKTNAEGLELVESPHYLHTGPYYGSAAHYANELALDMASRTLAVYDDRAARLVFFKLSKDTNAIALSPSTPPVMMPWQIKLGASLASQAKLTRNARDAALTIQLLDDSDTKILVPLTDAATTSQASRQDNSPEGMKAEDRILWSGTATDALKLVKREAGYPKALQLSSFSSWVGQSLNGLIPVDSPGRLRQLLVEMPSLTIDRQPELSQEATIQILSALELTQRENPSIGVTYVKVPNSWTDPESVLHVVNAAIQGHEQVSANKPRHHFLVLDARALGVRSGDDTLLQGIQSNIAGLVARMSGLTCQLVVLGRKELLGVYQARAATQNGRPIETRGLAIDDAFSEDFKIQLILQLLPFHYHGRQPTEGELRKLIDQIRSQTENKNVLSNMDEFLNRLGSILDARQPDFTSSAAMDEIVTLFRKLSGDRRPARFERAVIDSAEELKTRLSASSIQTGEKATIKPFVDRDAILESVKNELVTWLHYGSQHESPSLILTFLGDGGTGKTTLARAIAGTVHGAKIEEIKVSDLEKQFDQARRDGGYWMTPESHLLLTLQAAADRLILDPNPVKILLIDEAHVNPELFKNFLATADKVDANGNRALNLDGLIVIIAMNVDKSNENYQKLVDVEFGKGGYHEYASGLFQATLMKQKNPLTPEITGPVSTRLPKKYFFKPLSQNKEELERLIGQALKKLHDRHRLQIIIPDGVKAALLKEMDNYKGDNYRGIERMLDSLFAMAITKYERSHQHAQLEGRMFVLSASGTQFLLEDANTPENQRFVIQESYNQYCRLVKVEMQKEINAVRQYLNRPLGQTERDRTEYLAKSYERALAAFTAASERPLFKENPLTGVYEIDPGAITEFPRPDPRQGNALTKVSSLVGGLYSERPGEPVTVKQPHQVLKLLTYGKAMVIELERQGMDSSGQLLPGSTVFGPPSPWLERQGTMFVDWRSGNEKEDRRQREIEFMKTTLDQWRAHIKELETQALPAAKVEMTAKAAVKIQKALDGIPTENADRGLLDKFVTTLQSPGGLADAETMLKERETALAAPVTASVAKLNTVELADVSSGFLLDHFGRQLAAVQLKGTAVNTLGGDGVLHGETDPCHNTWDTLGREASEAMQTIFARHP